jgi:fructosamine-3-kinase
MLRLFGSPGSRFLTAYEDVSPLAPGHQDRVTLYQLFPLLVHAVLFGGGYGASVDRAARRYAG